MLSSIILRSTAAFGGAPFCLKKCTALSSAASGAAGGSAVGGVPGALVGGLMINMWKTINEEDKMNGSDNGLFITTSIGDFENKKILRTIVETYSDGFCVNTSVAIVEISDVPPTSQTEKNKNDTKSIVTGKQIGRAHV